MTNLHIAPLSDIEVFRFCYRHEDLRTGTDFSGLQDPPGCRHPPYQGGQGGSPRYR
jgi:hypothetical protein